MPEPVVELIAQDILTTLSGVKENDGYNYDLDPERALRRGNLPEHLKAVIYQDDPTETDQNPIHMQGWIQPFEVAVYVVPRENDTATPPDAYGNRLWADIAKALMIDPTRDGNAI